MKGLFQRELVATLRTRGSVINPLGFGLLNNKSVIKKYYYSKAILHIYIYIVVYHFGWEYDEGTFHGTSIS